MNSYSAALTGMGALLPVRDSAADQRQQLPHARRVLRALCYRSRSGFLCRPAIAFRQCPTSKAISAWIERGDFFTDSRPPATAARQCASSSACCGRGHSRRAARRLRCIARRESDLFAHWSLMHGRLAKKSRVCGDLQVQF